MPQGTGLSDKAFGYHHAVSNLASAFHDEIIGYHVHANLHRVFLAGNNRTVT